MSGKKKKRGLRNNTQDNLCGVEALMHNCMRPPVECFIRVLLHCFGMIDCFLALMNNIAQIIAW